MVYILLGSTCDVMGIRDTGGPSDLLIGLTMTGQLGRWLTAVVRCGPRNPDRFPSADRSEPLEVVIDPIGDRNPIEANSPSWRHGVVAVP